MRFRINLKNLFLISSSCADGFLPIPLAGLKLIPVNSYSYKLNLSKNGPRVRNLRPTAILS